MDLRDKLGVNKNLYNEVICPVCGQITLDSNWICDKCNWEYDGITEENEYSCANYGTIRSYKEKMGTCENPTLHFNVLPENALAFADFLSMIKNEIGLIAFDMHDFENIISKSKKIDFYYSAANSLNDALNDFLTKSWCYSEKAKVLAVISTNEPPDKQDKIELCFERIADEITPGDFYLNVYESTQSEKFRLYVLIAD